MQATGTTFTDVDPLTSNMPMLATMRQEYSALRSQRDDLADAFEKHDQTLYYPIDSEKPESKYYPTGLPSARALPMPPIAEIFDHESKSYAPAQRKLSTVVHLGA